jgi:hypothetical protein
MTKWRGVVNTVCCSLHHAGLDLCRSSASPTPPQSIHRGSTHIHVRLGRASLHPSPPEVQQEAEGLLSPPQPCISAAATRWSATVACRCGVCCTNLSPTHRCINMAPALCFQAPAHPHTATHARLPARLFIVRQPALSDGWFTPRAHCSHPPPACARGLLLPRPRLHLRLLLLLLPLLPPCAATPLAACRCSTSAPCCAPPAAGLRPMWGRVRRLHCAVRAAAPR